MGDETPKASSRDAEGVEGCGRGCPPPNEGGVWGLPLPRKFLEFDPPKDDILEYFYILFNKPESVFCNGNGLFSDH